MTPETPPPDEKSKPNEVPPPPKNEDTPPPKADYYTYFSSRTRDLIAYILLILGIIFLFINPLYGEFLVGAVFGAYFYEDIIGGMRGYREISTREGLMRSVIFGGLILALIIVAPYIFLGILFIALLKFFISAEVKRS